MPAVAWIRKNLASTSQQSLNFGEVPHSAAIAKIDQALQSFSQFPDSGPCRFREDLASFAPSLCGAYQDMLPFRSSRASGISCSNLGGANRAWG